MRNSVGGRYFRSLLVASLLAVLAVVLVNVVLTVENNLRIASRGLTTETTQVVNRVEDWLGGLSLVAIDSVREYQWRDPKKDRTQELRRLLRQESAISGVEVVDPEGNGSLRINRDNPVSDGAVFELGEASAWRALRMANSLPSEARTGQAPLSKDAIVVAFRDLSKRPTEVRLLLSRNYLDKLLRGIAPQSELVLSISDGAGRALAASRIQPINAQLNKVDSGAMQFASRYLGAYGLSLVRDAGSTYWVISESSMSALPWKIQARVPLNTLFTNLGSVTSWNAIIATVGLVFAGFFARAAANRLSHPVRELHAILTKIKSVDHASSRKNAIDELDEMLRLAPAIENELRASYELLESRVKEKTKELNELNVTLEARVEEKMTEVERLSALKRFVPASVAYRLVNGDLLNNPLESRRRDVAVVFLDLRGFSAFAESSDASVVMQVLHELHAAVGEIIERYAGTIERFTGDGAMVFFNDPEPLLNPCKTAIDFSMAVRGRANLLIAHWQQANISLGIGIGVAYGTATVGIVGYASRVDYGAIGPVTNLASRLCSVAVAGEILVQESAWRAGGYVAALAWTSKAELKGFSEPVSIVTLPADVVHLSVDVTEKTS